MPSVELLAPIVGDRIPVKGFWRNAGSVATQSGFNVKLEIKRENTIAFEQFVKVSQPVKPLEEHALDVTPEFVIPQPDIYQVILTLDPEGVIAKSRKGNNATSISLPEVPDLSQEPTFSKYPEDIAALTQAEKDIEKYRKGDAIITVLDSKGQPTSGLKVEYQQTRHSFLFGVAFPTPYDRGSEEKLRSLMKEAGINYTTIGVHWSSREPTPGVYRLEPGLTDTLRKYNFAGVGYSLIYLTKLWTVIPDYIYRSTFEEFRNAVYPHIYRVVSAYKQDIKIWNVLHEPMSQQANSLGLTSKQTIEIIKEGTRAIRDADPNARILIANDNAGGDLQGVYFYDFLKEALQSNVDFDIIGLEFYYNNSGRFFHRARRTLTAMAELIDKYSTLGKKIQITELSAPSDNIEGNKGYWDQLWSQELQAEYLKAAYTLFFSKPKVEAIAWWGAADRTGWGSYLYGSLLDEQDRPKKSYYALKQLINSWMTSGTSVTNDKGQVTFRGFGGTYDVTVTDIKTGLSKKQEVKIEEQKLNSITIVFD
ncbi:MAG: endo-1,4-beta-xylanase [Chloroflexota bacterium]